MEKTSSKHNFPTLRETNQQIALEGNQSHKFKEMGCRETTQTCCCFNCRQFNSAAVGPGTKSDSLYALQCTLEIQSLIPFATSSACCPINEEWNQMSTTHQNTIWSVSFSAREHILLRMNQECRWKSLTVNDILSYQKSWQEELSFCSAQWESETFSRFLICYTVTL